MINDTLLDRLKAGKRNIKLISFPGTTEQIALTILNEEERQLSTINADRVLKTAKLDYNQMMTASEFDAEKATQILQMSLKDPANLDRPFASIIELRKLLTKDIKGILIDEYLAFEQECSPSPDNLSTEEFDRIIETLKKNPKETVGSVTSIATARKLILILVSLLPS
jgi:hypothetical protein